MIKDVFVTGTDTNVGKTMVSAVLVAGLDGVYWKPIQTGTSEGTDRATVRQWAEIPEARTAPESYCFEPPVSPHLAAQFAGSAIHLSNIHRPQAVTDHSLIAEGAGGVLVPINDTELMIDLMRQLGLPVVVASRTALGTINHTLLTVRAVRTAGLELLGVVMNGPDNRDNEAAIEKYGDVPIVGRIPWLARIDRAALLQVFDSGFDRGCFEARAEEAQAGAASG